MQAGVSLIRSQNVLDSAMKLQGLAHISDLAASQLSGVTVQPGDVLLNITGESVARCALVDARALPARVNQHVMIVRPNAELDARYLQSFLVSPTVKANLLTMSAGGTRRALTKAQVGGLQIPLPPIREQQAIAEVLGALDDKIAANEKAWRLADDLRRLTFSSGLDDATHVPLSEVARFVNGRPFTKDASGSGRPVIRIAELNSGFGGSTVYNDIEVADDHVARPGDLLFAWSGSLTLRRWYLREGIVNQHIFKVLPAEGWPLWLVASLLERKLDEFKAIAADKATTMGHIQRRHLDDPVSVPTQGWLESNGAKLKSLWDIALAMELESQRLAALRDALLPELMSGRLRVKDVEKTVEEVV